MRWLESVIKIFTDLGLVSVEGYRWWCCSSCRKGKFPLLFLRIPQRYQSRLDYLGSICSHNFILGLSIEDWFKFLPPLSFPISFTFVLLS